MLRSMPSSPFFTPTTRVCMQRLRLKPQDRGGDHPEGAVAVAALVVPRGQAAKLLAAVDQPLHPIAQPVGGAVERAPAAFPALVRNGVPDAPSAAVRPIPSAGVPFVADHPVGPQARAAPAGPSHRALLQQLLEDGGFVLLARGQHQGQQLAAALGAEMDLGREAALGAAERFGRGVPPFAPAACWCARTTVPSTKWTVQSTCPAASAWVWTAANSRSQSPAKRQRRKRLYSVAQAPYRSGTSRQGAPVRSFQRMPLRIVRWSRLGRPVAGRSGGSRGASCSHCRSVSSWRRLIL